MEIYNYPLNGDVHVVFNLKAGRIKIQGMNL